MFAATSTGGGLAILQVVGQKRRSGEIPRGAVAALAECQVIRLGPAVRAVVASHPRDGDEIDLGPVRQVRDEVIQFGFNRIRWPIFVNGSIDVVVAERRCIGIGRCGVDIEFARLGDDEANVSSGARMSGRSLQGVCRLGVKDPAS